MRNFHSTSNFPIRQIFNFVKFWQNLLSQPKKKLFRAQNLKFASRCVLLLVKFGRLELRSIFRPRARGSPRVAAPTQLLYM